MTQKVLSLILACLLTAPPVTAAPPPARNFSDAARSELDRATARVDQLRQAYEAGAVSRRELEEAEAELRDVERRLREASGEPRELNVREARRRVAEARADFLKADAKAKRLRELYEAGAAARNDTEAAETAATQAKVYYQLNEELARQLEQLADMPLPSQQAGGFSIGTFFTLQDAYYSEFQQTLPVSAFGPSETHEKMGFDHNGRVDVALHPDSSEGRWLIAQLETRNVPYIAFRNSLPGKSTGPHIHLGFPSPVVGRVK